MGGIDKLWVRIAERIHLECGWSLRPLTRLGRPREGRRTWLAEAAAPDTSRRLRALLEPAWGHRLPATDLVHGDLNLTNVLADKGAITGVVDWDDVGLGCRAADLAGLLLDWHRLTGRPAGRARCPPDVAAGHRGLLDSLR